MERVLAALEWTTTSRIRTTRDGSTAIVAAAGEIDLSNVGELRSAVTGAAEDCDRSGWT